MNLSVIAIAITLATASATAFSQTPNTPPRPGERPAPMKPEQKCDALTGAAKAACLREGRRLPGDAARGPGRLGSCDAFIGPEKELCLKRGGTVEASVTSR